TLALTGAAGTALGAGLATDGWHLLDAAILPIFLVLFARTAFAAVSALVGRGWRAPPAEPAEARPRLRTALLLPVHNEETSRVFATAEAMREALVTAGLADRFDIFLLSDSTDPAALAREAEAAALLRLRAPVGIFHCRRGSNAGRKAGNIAHWVRAHGGAYAHFVILDADSVMEAETLRRLALAMEADPRAGLIQTVPTLIGGTTRFARLQQWAARAHGPVIARGLAAWAGEAGNYWGHNAIIRTRAFAAAAGLPELPGPRPFGGPILSHDFVEAALLRRAGWGVHLRPELRGSHEEPPPSLAAAAARDRRWCQGNLQHAGLLATPGLHPLSRLHLLDGVLAYLSSPLWALFLLLAAAQGALGLAAPGFGPLLAVMGLLLVPKLPGLRAAPADALRELVLTALIAPAAMVTQSRQILDILRGRDSGWAAQEREGAVPGWGEVLRQHRLHLGLGAALTASGVLAAPWLLAVGLPLLLAPGIARSLAAPDPSPAFGTPEERAPSPLLRRVAALRLAWQLDLGEGAALRARVPPPPSLSALLARPDRAPA
ncbi:MAG: glucans biosynthesis glucosyltransferase MdoH, partial [Acetobacteraceae bacterium]|nr:glucans biosynthesis glucosyltransferase MdoH [Acetobacteraceae bacterium]